jgi:hypothetical protein
VEDPQWWVEVQQKRFLSIVHNYVAAQVLALRSMNAAAIATDNARFANLRARDSYRWPHFGKIVPSIEHAKYEMPALTITLNASDAARECSVATEPQSFTPLANEVSRPFIEARKDDITMAEVLLDFKVFGE